MKRSFSFILLLGIAAGTPVYADALSDSLAAYRNAGAGPFSVKAGEAMWDKPVSTPNGDQRRCASCHTVDLTRPGRHARTGKAIKPMAPSVNARRLTDRDKIEKWFLRNCKWTFGRECTPQEKGDFLSFISSR
jgi:hypothetical protein